MASDSQTATATTSEKSLENKVNEEANLMEKEIVLSETVDAVKDKPVSDSDLTVEREEESIQTPADEPEKQPSADVEEAAAVVKADESVDGEKKVVEQVELKEPTLVKEGVAEVNVQAVDGVKAEEGKGKDENGEEKVAEEVVVKEPTLVKESVDAEKAEVKLAVESVAEEDNKDKEEEKMVDVSESADGAGGKQVEPAESVDVEVLEVEPKPETSEEVESQTEKAKEMVPEVEVVRTEETPETKEQAKVSIVETKDSSINSKDEKTSESDSALCPKETAPVNQDSDTSLEKEAEGDVSSPPDVIEKAKTEEKDVVEEPSKDKKEKVSEEAKDVVSKLATEDENIKKENDTESTEVNKQEESITEKVAEVVEAETVAKESDEPKQEPEITTEEVSVKPKHSNSIMSKVKQSLVKAKKAIIGKSPSSKTITTEETKEEVKAK